MMLRSLLPSRDSGALVRPDFGLFGLHREIDRLFNDFAQGDGADRRREIDSSQHRNLRDRQSHRSHSRDAGA